MIYIGADHRGFELKEKLFKRLVDEGYKVVDLAGSQFNPSDDYVDIADKVAEAVLENSGEGRGILLCGSGVGVDIVANKHDGIRCALVDNVRFSIQSREHEDVNVIALPADMLEEDLAWQIVDAFLITPFSGEERHIRRLEKLQQIEETHE